MIHTMLKSSKPSSGG